MDRFNRMGESITGYKMTIAPPIMRLKDIMQEFLRPAICSWCLVMLRLAYWIVGFIPAKVDETRRNTKITK